MSRMTVSSYRDLEAERRRAEARDRARLARRLKVLQKLEKQLSQLDDVPSSSSSAIVERLSDKVMQLQPAESQNLLHNLENDITQIQELLETANADRHRIALTARTLLQRTDGAKKTELEYTVKHALKADRSTFNQMKSEIETIVTERVMSANSDHQEVKLSAEANALARALMSPSSERRTIDLPSEDVLNEPMSRLVKALSVLGPAGHALSERAHQLVAEPEVENFHMKLDTILIEAAELRQAQIRTNDVRARIDRALDALAPFDDPDSAALRNVLSQSEAMSNEEQLQLASRAEQHAKQQAVQEDGEKARRALLEGLVELGYEVSVQGGEWQKGERISARRPNEPNYDVQLAARADGKVQTKVRAFRHAGRSDSANVRDAEVEESWCADLKQLHERLEESNLGALLEHEDQPGTGSPLLIDKNSESKKAERASPISKTSD